MWWAGGRRDRGLTGRGAAPVLFPSRCKFGETPYRMRSMDTRVEVPQEALERLCRRYRVRRLALFGSVLREDFGAESDLDVLVEFEPGHTPGLAFVRLQRELSDLMGIPVDLHTYRSLSRYFRDEVLEESRPLYERAARVP